MGDWEKSKQDFIDKLSQADRTFSEIFKVDSESLVIQGAEREELARLQAANKKVLAKLQSREFTVAIVGLEKAGKSTLGNALIKSMVLPEYAERCTYTTTEIRSGDTDVAEIYFYSREEFNKNFRRMLNDVKYPDAVDFFTMTYEAFDRYWKAVETDPDQRGIFMVHNGTTAEDIKAMLEGKNKILPLLGHAPLKFGAEYWTGGDEFNDFKVYITGMSGKNPDGSVIRQPHPYAVKNVIIRSTQLAEMSHLVLYDVPGFDSPTELHKRQTEEMLKTTDAIILVTNVGDRPNLTGTQLDMLRKGQDADGIKLSAKAFVFGNKIDRASDATTAQNNLAALTNESVNKYQIALASHIVGGSARAYLEREGLIAGDVAKKVIDEWQLPNGDGVGVLHKKMQDYYDNDRFEVLKRRAESTLTKTKEVLDNLLERYSSGELNYTDVSAEILMDIQSKLPLFIREANKITQQHTRQILSGTTFTSALQSDIEKIYPLSAAQEDLIQDVEYSLAIDPDGIYPTNAVNANVRDKLGKIFVENIVKSASQLTIQKQDTLRQALVESFLQIMGTEPDTPNKAELEASVNKLFDKMLIKEGSDCNFNALVERFVTTLIQTLITMPFAEDDRLAKVKATLPELISLSVYYNMPTSRGAQNISQLDNIGKNGVNFFSKILVHESVDVSTAPKPNNSKSATANENFLRGVFEDFAEEMLIDVKNLPLEKWARLITDAGINLVDMQSDPKIKGKDKFGNRLENLFNVNWQGLSAAQRTQAIENLINSYAKKTTPTAAADDTLLNLDELHEFARKVKRMQSKDDMISTLDADIEILRDITAKAVINAIGLERAFISVVTKNVELIREHLQASEGAKEFRAWIRNNAAKMMPSQFAQIIEQGAIRENRKAIVNSIKVMQSKWEV